MNKAREQVLWGCRTMCARGYALGTSGNISARVEGTDLFVITPTSVPYEGLSPDDLVVADLSGTIVEGARHPSIEFSMHRAILEKRPDVAAIVHTHSAYATAAGSTKGVSVVPLVDIESALYLGGDIRVAPFAPPGTPELAESVAESLGFAAGVILESHGAVGVGGTMEAAMTAADILERTCLIYMTARAAGGAKPLPEAYLARCLAESARKRGVS